MKLASPLFALPLLFTLAAGCSGDSTDDTGATTGDEDDLTSNTALSRSIEFTGVVFLPTTASDFEIEAAVNAQSKTGFGPLRSAKAVPNTRELKNADPTTFKKSEVEVVDTAAGTSTKMLRVTYRYKDAAVVDKSYATRSSVSLALLGKDHMKQVNRVFEECTDNSEHTREMPIWYEFDPTRSSCRAAIDAEQAAIDTDRKKLKSKKTQVTRTEVERLYLPINVKLGPNKTNKGTTYPEYQRLFAGGVEANKLVIGLVNGIIDDDASADITDDSGYTDWTDELEALVKARPFKIVATDPPADLSSFTVGSKKLTDLTVEKLVDLNNFRLSGFSFSEQQSLKKQVGARITRRWLTLEAPVSVKIGSEPARDVTLKVQTYFGVSSDSSVHKRAIKTSDVFIYNGHSYIGSGPLDPTRFSKSDFPSSYQILFIDGCVSYNYYEKDYFPLKEGGSKNLELITNGIEAPAFQSGAALGDFMAALLSGKQPSYRDLLTAAEATDSLRVVDGEVDNTYSPTKTPITVSPR